MIDFTKPYAQSSQSTEERENSFQAIFRAIYGWMTVGLVASGATAWWTVASGFYKTVFSGYTFLLLVLAELILVSVLSARIQKLSSMTAKGLFLAYSVLNGLTLSSIFLAYQLGSIQRIFFLAAAMFGGLALFGTMTRMNLSRIGSICMMGLFGIVIAILVNLFLKSGALDMAISVVGIVVFTGLTIWDAQKLRMLAENAAARGERDGMSRVAILGALELYLDFINLFLMLLNLFGKRR